MIDLAELERLAAEAAEGPLWSDSEELAWLLRMVFARHEVVSFIVACSPEVVAALVQAVRALQSIRAEVVSAEAWDIASAALAAFQVPGSGSALDGKAVEEREEGQT